MKLLTRTLAALAVLALMAAPAAAKDLDGKKGLGITHTIGGVSGLGFNYGLGNLQLEVAFGGALVSPDGGDSSFMLELAAGVLFPILRAEDAAVMIGGRFNLGMVTEPSATQFTIDVPLRFYWYAAEHFSLHAETGVGIRIVGDDGPVLAGSVPKGFELGLFDVIASLGVGATFWW